MVGTNLGSWNILKWPLTLGPTKFFRIPKSPKPLVQWKMKKGVRNHLMNPRVRPCGFLHSPQPASYWYMYACIEYILYIIYIYILHTYIYCIYIYLCVVYIYIYTYCIWYKYYIYYILYYICYSMCLYILYYVMLDHILFHYC